MGSSPMCSMNVFLREPRWPAFSQDHSEGGSDGCQGPEAGFLRVVEARGREEALHLRDSFLFFLSLTWKAGPRGQVCSW